MPLNKFIDILSNIDILPIWVYVRGEGGGEGEGKGEGEIGFAFLFALSLDLAGYNYVLKYKVKYFIIFKMPLKMKMIIGGSYKSFWQWLTKNPKIVVLKLIHTVRTRLNFTLQLLRKFYASNIWLYKYYCKYNMKA